MPCLCPRAFALIKLMRWQAAPQCLGQLPPREEGWHIPWRVSHWGATAPHWPGYSPSPPVYAPTPVRDVQVSSS